MQDALQPGCFAAGSRDGGTSIWVVAGVFECGAAAGKGEPSNRTREGGKEAESAQREGPSALVHSALHVAFCFEVGRGCAWAG